MKPKRCTACERQWFGSSNACPDCGAPKRSRHHAPAQTSPNLKNVLWVAAAVMVLIVLLHMT